MKLYIILFNIFFFLYSLSGQIDTATVEIDTATVEIDTVTTATSSYDDFDIKKMEIKGKVYSVLISNGDTMVIADMQYINISSMRLFTNEFEKKKYYKFKDYSRKVYDIAQEAIQVYKEFEYVKTLDYPKRKLKKELNRLEDELKDKFESKLKKLTKLQGKIMIKMIEKETGKTMYSIIKEIRGGFTAFYWHNFGKLYSYDLKEGYEDGKYPIFDGVINDVTFEKVIVDNSKQLKYIHLK